ncbi:MAG TPA: gamma-glutamylcyclotransferase family protein [Longimicrobiales bacterium]|nr:gamma-glutamylcyclotransferase family protein [Longimicrobiales bacterium]
MAEENEARFNLFVYGTLRAGGGAAELLAGCERVGEGAVSGMLYDIDGRFPAIVLYGDAPVPGEIWRCPATMLLGLDAYEGTADGLFRRVGIEVKTTDGTAIPCWVYVAGPALSRKLLPTAHLPGGVWTPTTGVLRRDPG